MIDSYALANNINQYMDGQSSDCMDTVGGENNECYFHSRRMHKCFSSFFHITPTNSNSLKKTKNESYLFYLQCRVFILSYLLAISFVFSSNLFINFLMFIDPLDFNPVSNCIDDVNRILFSCQLSYIAK